jgi:hypothetical protein
MEAQAETVSPGHLVFAAARAGKRGSAAATLTIPWERRGDFARLWREIVERTHGPEKFSWKRLKRRARPLVGALFDDLLGREWVQVEAVVSPETTEEDAILRYALARTGGGNRVRVAKRDLPRAARAGFRSVRALAPSASAPLRLVRVLVRALAETPKRRAQAELAARLEATPRVVVKRMSPET